MTIASLFLAAQTLLLDQNNTPTCQFARTTSQPLHARLHQARPAFTHQHHPAAKTRGESSRKGAAAVASGVKLTRRAPARSGFAGRAAGGGGRRSEYMGRSSRAGGVVFGGRRREPRGVAKSGGARGEPPRFSSLRARPGGETAHAPGPLNLSRTVSSRPACLLQA